MPWCTRQSPRRPRSIPAVDALLALADPPTAVFSANVNTSVGLLAGLRQRHWTPAIVAFSDFDAARIHDPTVTVVDNDPVELGRRGAELALRTPRRLSRSEPARCASTRRSSSDRATWWVLDDDEHGATPDLLPPNVVEHFYRGGERIAALRGASVARQSASRRDRFDDRRSGSAPRSRGGEPTASGLTELGALGPLARPRRRRPARPGSAPPTSPGGARRPPCWSSCSTPANGCRSTSIPTAGSPPTHLGCPFGKTEAWVVLDVPSGGGTVFVGTTRPVRREEWAELVDDQAVDAMLELLHPLRIDVGDGVLVPASTPHCLDAGVFVVELQEPTDFSVLLEWDGFDVDGPADGHLGLGFDVGARRRAHRRPVDRPTSTASSGGRHSRDGTKLAIRVLPLPGAPTRTSGPGPSTAAAAPVTVPAAFSIVVVTGGAGTLRWAGGSSTIARGDALVVPHAAGPLTFDGGDGGSPPSLPSHRSPDAPEPVEGAAP